MRIISYMEEFWERGFIHRLHENNAFFIFAETKLSFESGCPYVHPDGKFRPRVFKLIYMDYITFGESHSD